MCRCKDEGKGKGEQTAIRKLPQSFTILAAPTSSPRSTTLPPDDSRAAARARGADFPASSQVACFRAIPSNNNVSEVASWLPAIANRMSR